MQVWSLVQEDPLEEEMATHSRILAWEMPRAEEPGRLQSTGVTKESDTTSQLNNEIEVHLLHGRPWKCGRDQEAEWLVPTSVSLLSVPLSPSCALSWLEHIRFEPGKAREERWGEGMVEPRAKRKAFSSSSNQGHRKAGSGEELPFLGSCPARVPKSSRTTAEVQQGAGACSWISGDESRVFISVSEKNFLRTFCEH